jgi:hypothetical protein
MKSQSAAHSERMTRLLAKSVVTCLLYYGARKRRRHKASYSNNKQNAYRGSHLQILEVESLHSMFSLSRYFVLVSNHSFPVIVSAGKRPYPDQQRGLFVPSPAHHWSTQGWSIKAWLRVP